MTKQSQNLNPKKKEQENKQPEEGNLSIIPFEAVLSEIAKLQGTDPAMVVLYKQGQITFLKHNFNWNDPVMMEFMKHLTLQRMKAEGIEVKIIKKE